MTSLAGAFFQRLDSSRSTLTNASTIPLLQYLQPSDIISSMIVFYPSAFLAVGMAVIVMGGVGAFQFYRMQSWVSLVFFN
jgi:hypothetical protein